MEEFENDRTTMLYFYQQVSACYHEYYVGSYCIVSLFYNFYCKDWF